MESVDILAGVDRDGDGMLVDMLRRRGLDKNAVNLGVDIQSGD